MISVAFHIKCRLNFTLEGGGLQSASEN